MPAVIKPDPQGGKNHDRIRSSPLSLLSHVSPRDCSYPIIRSSFSPQQDPRSTGFSSPIAIVPKKNGFAHTIIRAWQQDLHLKLRPDDVWLAILTQFSFFVNGNAEALRPLFVAHEGQQELVVDARPATVETADIGALAQWLATMVKGRLRDPNVATTLLPSFTTTTPHDRAVAAIAFLGSMKEYFEYDMKFGCSFPSVTLLGERSDWADLLQRVAWFGTIGHVETTTWATRLAKVLEYMVASFDSPDGADVKRFWNRAVHEAGGNMSGGIVTLSGWLTAFCWWGADGKRVQTYTDEELWEQGLEERGQDGYRRLTLDGVQFPVIERERVPTGIVRVPVTLRRDQSVDKEKAVFLAGSMGMQVIEEEDGTAAQPASGWWLLSLKAAKPENTTTARKRPPPESDLSAQRQLGLLL
ncbi:hypothetical protein C8A01DRAFT_42333 [Parachaetomium inaequale]|uniref:DUF4419 domain-containing protein n=1 Tax=Parachaetomium inaequale TaxID=2588326 RepID=A0AAN6P3T2_9PEZI|nr:hypothetical protein C8A01DRAFT_42333 [Parachaetomium inaequale]